MLRTDFVLSQDVIRQAIVESQAARTQWERTPLSDRIKLFQKAADLVSGKYRMDLNATTMLGQVSLRFRLIRM